MMQTTYEKGMEKGKTEGLAQAVCLQLKHRFGELPAGVTQQLEQKSTEQLQEILIAILDAPSLEALGLIAADT